MDSLICLVQARQTTRMLTSRMMLHLQYAVMAGQNVSFVHTVDSDGVVLSVRHYPAIQNLGVTDFWTCFGCENKYN